MLIETFTTNIALDRVTFNSHINTDSNRIDITWEVTMGTDRRTLLKYGIASLAAIQTIGTVTHSRKSEAAPADENIKIVANPGYQRIGCEAAWTLTTHYRCHLNASAS